MSETETMINDTHKRLEYERADMFTPGRPVLVNEMRGWGFAENSAKLKVGDRVRFERELGHSWDPNAIVALTEDGRRIGYLDRHLTTDMARGIDCGRTYAAEFEGPIKDRDNGNAVFRMVRMETTDTAAL